MEQLRVGAGQAVINYTDEMLPNFGENYTCVHDDSYVQVLYIEQGSPVAIVAVGSVNAPEPETIREIVAGVFGIELNQVCIYGKHVLSAPHASKRDSAEHLMERAGHMGREITLEEANEYVKKNHLMCDAVAEAAKSAAIAAKAGTQNAVMRWALGNTDVVCNRLVRTSQGWWQGHNPDIPADGSMPVIRFDSENGAPVAILFGVNAAPGVLENSFLSDGGRAISGDLAAAAERMIESQYGNDTVAIYGIGATGDQWQSLRALNDEIDKDGNQIITDLHEAGFILLDVLASRLATAVVKAAEASEVVEVRNNTAVCGFMKKYPGQKLGGNDHRPPHPQKEVTYEQSGENDLGLNVIDLGDTAILMTGVELGSRSWKKIKKNSPYKNMLILEFAGLGGGYLLEEDYYEMVTYQSQKTRFYAGTAEKYTDDIINYLNELWNKNN